MGIQISPIEPQDRDAVAKVMGRAYATSPLNVAALGPNVSRNEALFRAFLGLVDRMMVAKDDGEVVGAMAFNEWPACQPSKGKMLPLLPAMIAGVGVGSMVRVFKWMPRWAKHDPAQPHWHFGPFAVDPERQRQGIGSALLEHFCEHVDGHSGAAYLETDAEDNVRLYNRFGFKVTAEDEVLGVPNWFMWRAPSAS